MKLRDAIWLFADAKIVCRYGEDSGAYFVTYHGHITNEELSYLCDAGFIYSQNGTYRLSDEGFKAWARMSDELQDGKLVPPIQTLRQWPGGNDGDHLSTPTEGEGLG